MIKIILGDVIEICIVFVILYVVFSNLLLLFLSLIISKEY